MDLRTDHRQITIVGAVVIAVHLGAFVVFEAALRYRNTNDVTTESPSTLIFIAAQVAPRRTLRDATKIPSEARHPKARADDKVHEENSQSELASSTAIADPKIIDWYEQGMLANAHQLKLAERAGKQKHFDATDRPPGLPMPKAAERSEIAWDPLGGRRIGLTNGGLFFVKLSNKCMILALFLVCQFGGEIKADGKLFERLPDKLDRARERELP